jgi:hypothetical protein
VDDVDQVIEACAGDPRAAIKALLVANSFLEAELERAHSLLSKGFVRGKFRIVSTDRIARGDKA